MIIYPVRIRMVVFGWARAMPVQPVSRAISDTVHTEEQIDAGR